MSSNLFIPTYLYIKRHSVTGKLYFGKTTGNPEKYDGSGLHWKRHIKIHGKEHVETPWYCLFLDEESIKEFALSFSEQNNIVESEEWLNLQEENGIDGAPSGYSHSSETRKKISEIFLGKSLSLEHRQKLSASMQGKKHSVEHRRKLSESRKGKSYPAEARLRISETLKGKHHEKVTCPHCNKTGGNNSMKRYHLDNCKFKV